MYKRSYSELMQIEDFTSRLNYLMLNDNNVDSPREEAIRFFKSYAWKTRRLEIIKRDLAFDLGVLGVNVPDIVLVHHINPITIQDLMSFSPVLLDPENLITTSRVTHNIIHYGHKEELVERKPGDTILW